jgi:hypothetical protein
MSPTKGVEVVQVAPTQVHPAGALMNVILDKPVPPVSVTVTVPEVVASAPIRTSKSAVPPWAGVLSAILPASKAWAVPYAENSVPAHRIVKSLARMRNSFVNS